LSAPVPAEYARRYDAKTPSEYGDYQVATGPYMFLADAHHRVLGAGYKPGESATLVRNPNWDARTDYRPACLDRIDIRIGGDPNVIGRQVLEGSHMVQNDPPAAGIVQLADEHFRHQLEISPGAGDYYVTLNNSSGPFRNVNLRRAVWAALDRAAMDRARGGELVTTVMTHFLYPTIAGFAQAGGLAGPQVDFNQHPAGDSALAAEYMRLAGYPSGKYTGSALVQIVGSNAGSDAQDAEIVNDTLQRLGFKTRLTLLEPAAMYSKYCADLRERIDVCPSVGWRADFGDPQAVLDLAFNGKLIVANGYNSNWGAVNHPRINQAMTAAETVVGTSARARAWAEIDDALVREAVAIPYAWDKAPQIESKDVAGVGDLWNTGSWDYSFTSLR
jgi:peptide/nickel transport system substrate-binding protein